MIIFVGVLLVPINFNGIPLLFNGIPVNFDLIWFYSC